MLLQASGICKSFIANTVLSHIHLQVQDKERIGIVGVNGAGKSTLLKILAGELSADSGNISVRKDVRIGYLAQKSDWSTHRTIWDELMSVHDDLLQMEREMRRMERQMADPAVQQEESLFNSILDKYDRLSVQFNDQGGYAIEAGVRAIMSGMGFSAFPPETEIHTLSGGQKTRLALAKLLLQAPDLLMLDEPTNYLDIETLTWLESYLKNYSGAILVVSHDRFFLDAVVETIYEIERTTSKRYSGNYSTFIEAKAKDYEIAWKHFEKQQDEIGRMEDFIRRNIVRASTTKRAQSRRKALERMERVDKPDGILKKAHFRFEIRRTSGNDVLQTDALSAGYDRGHTLIQQATFTLERGDAVALIGPNGIGKSTLLKTLVGELAPVAGSFRWGANVDIGYYDQEHTGLRPDRTVLDEVWDTYPHIDETDIRTVLGNFLFSGEDVEKKINMLSGGEKARVSLAKLMLKQANMLVLDEPTNHLDLYSKEVLEAALSDYEGTLLFISHDRYFLNKMAERVLELNRDGLQHFLGNYDDYVAKKLEMEEIEAEKRQSEKNGDKASGLEKSNDYAQEKRAKGEERMKQRKLQQIEQTIATGEQAIADLELEMAKPEVYQNYVQLQEIQHRLSQYREALDTAYQEWEALFED